MFYCVDDEIFIKLDLAVVIVIVRFLRWLLLLLLFLLNNVSERIVLLDLSVMITVSILGGVVIESVEHPRITFP
jgi:hypothetical protein